MNIKIIAALLMPALFSVAANAEEWVYKEKIEQLKSSPGCNSKEQAIALARSEYRFTKYTQMICQHEGYGWTLDQVKDPGTPVCDECGGADKGKYSCFLADVKVQCKIIKRGF